MSVSGSQESTFVKVSRQLKDANKWEKIDCITNFGKDFIIGQEKNISTPRYFYPVSSKEKFTFKTLKATIENSKQDSLTLAIQDSDSTTVFYEARIGLNPPVVKDSPSDI